MAFVFYGFTWADVLRAREYHLARYRRDTGRVLTGYLMPFEVNRGSAR